MDIIVNPKYIIDDAEHESKSIDFKFNPESFHFYEVLRTQRGILLFLEDHLARLHQSVQTFAPWSEDFTPRAAASLKHLVRINNSVDGNVKLMVKICSNNLMIAAYYTPHSYPNSKAYSQGVKLSTLFIERPEPNLKQIHVNEKIKKQIDSKLSNQAFFEVLLIDQEGYLTEGSRSNIFFVDSENHLCTAPDEVILQGITRKYVLQIAKELGVPVITKRIRFDELQDYKAAFICGTSPKILPVKTIDEVVFNTHSEIVINIRKSYDRVMMGYLQANSEHE